VNFPSKETVGRIVVGTELLRQTARAEERNAKALPSELPRLPELADEVARLLSLTDSDLAETTRDGAQSRCEYRSAWARSYLKAFGLLENSERGVWSLTPRGKETSKSMRQRSGESFGVGRKSIERSQAKQKNRFRLVPLSPQTGAKNFLRPYSKWIPRNSNGSASEFSANPVLPKLRDWPLRRRRD
jgi:Mrr N-terminal domain